MAWEGIAADRPGVLSAGGTPKYVNARFVVELVLLDQKDRDSPIASKSMAQAGCGYVRNYTCPARFIHLKVASSGFFWGGAVSIDPCLEQGVFAPEATTAMGEAFEAACEELHDGGRLPMVREAVALRIVAAARTGELNPVRLRTAALNWIIVTQMLSAVSR